MTTNKNTEKIEALADELIEDLFVTSDHELLAEATDDSGSVKNAIQGLQEEFEAALNAVAKEQLKLARNALDAARNSQAANVIDVDFAKQRLEEFLQSGSPFKITMAARKGQFSSEKELLSAFSDLQYLSANPRVIPRFQFGSAPKAELILRNLGITKPEEIDVEAIAWHLGAKIKYDYLESCEARIIGSADNAVITVDKRASAQRQRFSICHELGHWIYHRNKMLTCQHDDIERPSAESINAERVADRFASELLMPSYLFLPAIKNIFRPDLNSIRKLAHQFDASQTAAAIRFVELSELPLVLVCHGKSGRRWFGRSKSVADAWFPRSDLAPDSSAFTMIFGSGPGSMPPRTVSASCWFGRHDASLCEVVEHSLRTSAAEVLTLLRFKDADQFRRSAARHS